MTAGNNAQLSGVVETRPGIAIFSGNFGERYGDIKLRDGGRSSFNPCGK